MARSRSSELSAEAGSVNSSQDTVLKENSTSCDITEKDSNSAEKDAEGNLSSWLTVVGSSLVYFATFGIINSFGFFQNYYQTKFLVGTAPSTISFVGSIQITLMNLLAAPAGSLFDCYGLRVRIA
jgi:MFS transporter, MCT family, solute carrier family 16 (monocarboxylic acid transporters), member 10